MKLLFSPIKYMVFMAVLLPCLSCTADAKKVTSESKSDCAEIGHLIHPLSDYLNEKMAILLKQPPEHFPELITPELLQGLTLLIECSTRLTELELKEIITIDRERCDPFPISITLNGLEDNLEEVANCGIHTCSADQISLKKKITQQQIDRLKMLVNKCGTS